MTPEYKAKNFYSSLTMKNNQKELVTVILAINKIDKYFESSIKSILNQSHRNIELIIIANGEFSVDIKEEISSKYKDHRLEIITTPIGQLSFALNLGLHHSKGSFIARMDADDICDPFRIEKQLNFILSTEADIVSSNANIIDENGKIIGERLIKNNISEILFFKNPITHPSVLYRKNSIIKLRGYNSGFNSEDYDLWHRASREKMIFKNIPENLISYRVHQNSTQGKKLGYAEVTGLSIREFLLTKNIKHLAATFINILKFFFKGR